MRLEVTVLRSRVALHTFALFVVSALIPVSVLAVLSHLYFTRAYYEEVEAGLKESAKAYGITLFARLTLAESALLSLLQVEGESGFRQRAETLTSSSFKGVFMHSSGGAIQWAYGQEVPAVVVPGRGNSHHPTAILVMPNEASDADIIMWHRFTGFDGLEGTVAGLLDPSFLWGDPYDFDLRRELCVHAQDVDRLFCSSNRERSSGPEQIALLAPPEQEDSLAQGWQLFLGSAFVADPWRIEQRIATSIVEEELTGLRVIFPQFIVLTLLLVGLLSVFFIRKNFMPLEALMEGIQRIGERNFSQPVRETGNDEFTALARAFNQMSGRIHRQIRAFMVLSMIDRGILARESMGQLIARLLEQAVPLTGSEFATVALADHYHPEIFYTHWFSGDAVANVPSTRLRFAASAQEQALIDARTVFRVDASEGLFGSLLGNAGIHAYHLLGCPVFLEDRFAGLFALGFRSVAPELPGLSQIVAELAERVAVALSHAAWEERLQHLAYHDALTRLPNRLLLEDRLKQSLARAYRSGNRLAVVFLDLDRFKTVNDSLGHNAGDALLLHVSKCLQEPLRSDDTLARLAGDEFIILIPNLPADAEVNLGFSAIIQRLLYAVNTPFVFQQRELRPSASLGVAVYPDDGTDAETLLKNADAAMYHAKALGRGRYHFFSEELNAGAVHRLDLEADLHRALENRELRLVYQPKLNLSSGIVADYEALVRWEHPVRGWLNPGAFLDVAEEAGMMVDMGRWVLEEACRMTRDLVNRGLARSRVAVNLSAQQFHDINLVDEVQRILNHTGLDPWHLELEITEGAAMQDMGRAIQIVAELKRLGAWISIDDFGTGYSSLSYLKRFEVDALKIDRSFIIGLETDAKDAAIVSSTILLAHNLGLEVIAEGVENENQLAILREAGCDAIQGYHISKPVPADRLETILRYGWEDDRQQDCAAAACR